MSFELPSDGGVIVSPERIQAGKLSKHKGSNRVLVVEDDEVLSRFLERFLHAEGFQVESAHDGAVVLEALSAGPDLVLLDLNLPNMDGITLLQQLRPFYPKLPVLVLTGRSRSESAALALESGADDCLTKPFSCIELVARVRALLRRTRDTASGCSRCSDLLLDRDGMRVERGGKRLDLTQREFALLEYLMRTPRTPVPRSALLQNIWGNKDEMSSNIVDVYMKYVRDKVDLPGLPKLIHTIRGVGYVVSEN